MKKINIDYKLNNEDKVFCDQEITDTEIHNAIKVMKGNKSPGCDGLSPEFLKKYWVDIKVIFMDMVNESFTMGELPDSLSHSDPPF